MGNLFVITNGVFRKNGFYESDNILLGNSCPFSVPQEEFSHRSAFDNGDEMALATLQTRVSYHFQTLFLL